MSSPFSPPQRSGRLDQIISLNKHQEFEYLESQHNHLPIPPKFNVPKTQQMNLEAAHLNPGRLSSAIAATIIENRNKATIMESDI